ncbi:MAG: SLC13 family permease [Thalassobaculum sp.]|uniref:SLC13 family permease n=1 Tax=Thalassobaculum sp. TaxID=2022740 RepID=UPI0032ED031A
MTALVLGVFVAVYAGLALGRLPGLAIDRTGFALLGALVLYAVGAIDGAGIAAAVDMPTLAVLFGLMVLSAQFYVSGFYDLCAHRIADGGASPHRLLALTVIVSGGLSAVLANDVVVFAMTPLLCHGLTARGLDPRPYLIALAGAANAGSAATIIGNPQNILIGQAGGLDFWRFLAVCGPPALAALAVVYATVAVVWRRSLAEPGRLPGREPPPVDRRGIVKAGLATVALLACFALPVPQATGVLVVAGALLVSRRRTTREMLAHVDWPLLLLFAGLFVITDAVAALPAVGEAVAGLQAAGLEPSRLGVMAPLALAASNTIGNVPAVVLILALLPDLGPAALHALALLSTLAGNLLLVGSLANLIVAERAAGVGVRLGFRDHARCGVPMTLASMAVAVGWLLMVT